MTSYEDPGVVARLTARAGIAGIAGVVVRTLLRAVLVPFAIRWLAPVDYRQWVALMAWVAILSIAELGTTAEVTRRVARHDDPAAVTNAVALTLAVGAVLLVVAIALAHQLAHAFVPAAPHRFGMLLVLTTAAAVVQVLAGPWEGLLRGAQRGDVAEAIGLGASVAGTAVALVGLAAGFGVGVVVVALWTEALLGVGLMSVASRRFVTLTTGAHRPTFQSVVVFASAALLLALSQVSEVVDTEIDKLILTHQRPVREVIAFTAGSTIAAQARILAATAMLPLLAATARLSRLRPQSGRQLWERSTTVLTAAGVALIGLVAVLARGIAPLVDDHRGGGTANVVAGCAVAAVANLVAAGAALRAIAEGRHRLTAAASAVNIAINAAVALSLTPHFGVAASVAGSIAANVVATTAFYVFLRDSSYRYDIVPVAVVVVVAVAGVFASHADSVVVTTAAAAALVVTTVVVLRVRCGDALADIWNIVRERGRLETPDAVIE